MRTLQIAAVAFAALVVSTSMASAIQLTPNLVVPVGPPSGVVNVPIDIEPVRPPIKVIPDTVPEPPGGTIRPRRPHVPVGDPGDTDDSREPLTPGVKPVILDLSLDCEIRDKAPTTDAFWIINTGEKILPAGLKLRYSVPASGDHGAFLLPRDILAGKKGLVHGLIGEQVASGSECRIQILS